MRLHLYIILLLSYFTAFSQNNTPFLYAKLKANNLLSKPNQQIKGIGKSCYLSKKAKQRNFKSKSGIERIVKVYYDKSLTAKEAQRFLLETNEYEYVTPSPTAHPLFIPNDPFAADNFSNSRDGQTPLYTHSFWDAWDIEQGDSNIVIAIIDGGVNFEHEDLIHSFKTNLNDPVNGINDDDNWFSDTSYKMTDDYRGWDVSDWDNDPSNPPGVTHGTEVTGIASATPNNGVGISGTGYYSKFVHYKVASNNDPYNYNTGYEGAIIAAENGADIINLSWGAEASVLEGFLPLINDALTYITEDLGVTVIAAAGNSGQNEAYYPASHPGVISVTGIREDNTKQNLSTYNNTVNISACGWFAKTTLGNTTTDYSNATGTSIASPVVSGAAALLKSKYPNFTSKQINKQLIVSGDIIDTIAYNMPFQYKIGRKLNPFKALSDTTLPGIQLTDIDSSFTVNMNGDNVNISFDLINYLSPLQNGSIELISLAPEFLTTTSPLLIPSLATFENNNYIDAFSISTPSLSDTVTIDFVLKVKESDFIDFLPFSINFYPDLISSTPEFLTNEVISISPNPNNGSFSINLSQSENVETISIYNTAGIFMKTFNIQKNGNRIPVELNHFSEKGLYLLHITTSNGFFTEKIWIQ